MKYHFILKKFDLKLAVLENKIKSMFKGQLTKDIITNRLEFTGNLDLNKLNLDEIDVVLLEEKPSSLLKFEDLRNDLLNLAKKYKELNLRVKLYTKINLTASSLKNRLVKYLNKEGINILDSNNNLLVEIFKDGNKVKYRIFSYKKMINHDKGKYSNITVLIEHPRLVEEISDFLRLCLIFDLNFKVIYNDKRQFQLILNNAKTITKGKLSDFNVDVINNLDEINIIKVGFSKHAKNNEADFIKFLRENKDKDLLFVFGNDLYGLSQKTRDKLDYCFSLTPDKVKPLKANQALAYALGIYTTIKQ